MKNRFNRLTSKEWLPYQKSWFRADDIEKYYRETIRFFVPENEHNPAMFYKGENESLVKKICKQEGIILFTNIEKQIPLLHYVLVDLIESENNLTLKTYETARSQTILLLQQLYTVLDHRKFVTVFIKNVQLAKGYYPFAWDLSAHISSFYSLKDERIGCKEGNESEKPQNKYQTGKDILYQLNYRKDELSSGVYTPPDCNFFKNNNQQVIKGKKLIPIPAWFILKPQPRKKTEILHPAKYPEDLVQLFLNTFTNENEHVFDPMSGTGSTQLAALKNKRNGYGTELSEFFAEIAHERLSNFQQPEQTGLFHEPNNQKFLILNKDARHVTTGDFPLIDYVITSPPYWDMLNMKGAENQAKRVEKGLQTNYSDRTDDLGNIADYKNFVNVLVDVYFSLLPIIKPGSFITIVVKNIKKKGSNYPFAWDLSQALQEKLILLPENFWCQDDISIAPYGYGNTWVSNTFHQYCLNFQVPV